MNRLKQRLEQLQRKLAPREAESTGPIILVEIETREQVQWLRGLPANTGFIQPDVRAGENTLSFMAFAQRLVGDLPAPPGVKPGAWRRRKRPAGTLVGLGAVGL